MKKIMSVMFVMIMAFTLIFVSGAGAGSPKIDNAGTFHCVAGPAFTDYTDARLAPCPANSLQTPDVMGGW
ncbi:exported hypothetical protein [Syntrophobacter sp. SbD1]|nr:exported hypothetical protein [Syntrophobacter sp. SbD1]